MYLQRLVDRIDDERRWDEERYLIDRERISSGVEFLNRWIWEWFCTMNLYSGCSYPNAEDHIKEWRIKLSTSRKIRIAYQGVFNLVPHPHIHLVALGVNRHGKTLRNIDGTIAEACWHLITKQSAVVDIIDDDCNVVCGYIGDKNSPSELSETIIPYNKKLLTAKRITK
jgi:hypothetical protein